jgi:hypothetical protein
VDVNSSNSPRSFTVGAHVVPIYAHDVYFILGLSDQEGKKSISKNRADPKLFRKTDREVKLSISISSPHTSSQLARGIGPVQ